MGCWNHTCAITNLPIYEDEDVVVILLKARSEPNEDSFCYPTAYYAPLPFYFEGKYNDYGAVKDCHGAALDIIVDKLREKLFELEQGENQFHDIPAKRNEFDIDMLFSLDHENRLFIHNPVKSPYDMREKIYIKHIVIRKEVFDGIVDGIVIDSCLTGLVTYKDLVNQFPLFTKDVDDIVSLDKDHFARTFWRMTHKIGDTTVAEFLAYNGQGSYGMNHPLDANETLFSLREKADKRYWDVLDNAVRMSLLMTFMVNSRKSWHIPSGVGSQEDSTNCQELCATLTLSSANKLKKYFEERWED